jgi:hypothetical protein
MGLGGALVGPTVHIDVPSTLGVYLGKGRAGWRAMKIMFVRCTDKQGGPPTHCTTNWYSMLMGLGEELVGHLVNTSVSSTFGIPLGKGRTVSGR